MGRVEPRVTRCRRASTSTSPGPEPRDEALAGLARRGPRATRRTPATRASGFPTRGTPTGSRRSSRATSRPSSTSGSCSRNKGVHLLLEALRGFDARARRSSASALPRTSSSGWRAPPDEPTLFTGPFEHRHLVHLLPLARRDGRPVDLPGGLRHGRGRGRGGRLPAARRAPLRPSPRSRPRSRPSTRRSSATSPRSRPATPPISVPS